MQQSRTIKLIILMLVLLIPSLFLSVTSLANTEIPKDYYGLSLGMTKEQITNILSKWLPGGQWSQDSTLWRWCVQNEEKFVGVFNNDQLTACFLYLDYQPFEKTVPDSLKYYGAPIQYDYFEKDDYAVTWFDGKTMINIKTHGYKTRVWLKNKSIKAFTLPDNLRGIKLGMSKKDTQVALNKVLPGIKLQPNNGVLKDNGLKDRLYIQLDDSVLMLSFVNDTLAEITMWPWEFLQNNQIANADKNYGDPLLEIDSQNLRIWFDGNVVMTCYTYGVRLVSWPLYQKAFGQFLTPNWNTSNMDTSKNGNYQIAQQILNSSSSTELLKLAVNVNFTDINSAAKTYIGKLVRFTGKVVNVESYEAGSNSAQIFNQNNYTMLVELNGGTAFNVPIHVIQLSYSGDVRQGQMVTVVGYVTGIMTTMDESGVISSKLMVVSKIINPN